MATETQSESWDRYTGSDGMTHRRFQLGPSDATPDVIGYPPEQATRPYHVECFGCWNGNAHSEAFHDKHAIGPRFRE